MDKRKIDVDEAVWELLKKNAQASGESPNDVLKRLLIKGDQPKSEEEPHKPAPGSDWKCS